MGFSTKTIQLWAYLHDYGNPHECFSCFVFWADWDPDLQNRQSGGVPPCPSTEYVHQNMSKKNESLFAMGQWMGKYVENHSLIASHFLPWLMFKVQSWEMMGKCVAGFYPENPMRRFLGSSFQKKTTPMIHETQHSEGNIHHCCWWKPSFLVLQNLMYDGESIWINGSSTRFWWLKRVTHHHLWRLSSYWTYFWCLIYSLSYQLRIKL